MAHQYDIAIIGGGAAGFTAGLYAARERCRAVLIERFSPGGQVLNCEHEGDGAVRRVVVEDVATRQRSPLEASGVFLYPGLVPNTEFLGGLVPLDERGQIVTDLWMHTAVPGVLAAGDVRHESARQLVSSAGDGATAALAAIRYLRSGEWQ